MVGRHRQLRHTGEHRPIRELREQEPKAVVRFFLFQSIAPDSIPDDADLQKLEFTRAIFIRKGGVNNPNQLMPVGGKVDEGETLSAAARREVVQETHLRPSTATVRHFSTVQNYDFPHKSSHTQKHRRSYVLSGRVLPQPMDVPYALDPEEDKIETFEYLSPSDVDTLLEEGHVETAHGTGELLDSLLLHEQDRAQRGVITDQAQVEDVHDELRIVFALTEVDKKMSVIRQIIRHQLPTVTLEDRQKYQDLFQEMEQEMRRTQQTVTALLYGNTTERVDLTVPEIAPLVDRLTGEVENGWQLMLRALHLTVDDVRTALRYSNTEAMVHYASEQFDMKRGKGIPTINLIFPLLLSHDANYSDLHILAKNPQAKKLLDMTHLFSLLHRQHSEQTPAPQRKAIRHRIEALFSRVGITPPVDGQLSSEDLLNYFFHSGLIDRSFQNDFFDLSSAVDSYFERLQHDANVVHDVSLDQVNEVKGQPLETIVQYAFGTAPDLDRASEHHQRIVRWEAQRKLIEMMMLHEVMNTRRSILRNGIGPIDRIERQLESPASVGGQRVIRLDGRDHNVMIERREKSPMSLLRKVMVRDQMITPVLEVHAIAKDVYAEAYVFTGREANTEWQTFQPSCEMFDGNNQRIDQFDAPAVVGQLIEGLAQAAGDEEMKIIGFKAPPRNGESFASSGPGGGGQVRMAKFYIMHRDAAGVSRFREVQVFFPQGSEDEWISGEEVYRRKKEDDQRYGVSRLFDTQGLRSFMELNFPAEIYGDSIRKMYKGKV